MSRRFKIERDCYEDENYLYKKGHVTFQPGLTVLVGCNGCGKTTLMKQLENILKKDRKKARVFRYENEIHGGHSSMQEAMFYGDMSFVAASVMSSEGEKISLNMQKAAAKIGSLMKKSPDIDEFWLLLDGVDSGFSIDAIEDLKRGLFDTIFEMYPDKEIYIIVSANEYEMARGEMCFDVVNCRYVNIKSYDRYRKIVMKSREYKDARIEAAEKRAKKEKDKGQKNPKEEKKLWE